MKSVLAKFPKLFPYTTYKEKDNDPESLYKSDVVLQNRRTVPPSLKEISLFEQGPGQKSI